MTKLGPLWHERHQARLASRPRKPAIGAGTKHRLLLVDGLLATLVHLRHGPPHDVLACGFGADRSTITRAIGAVRPLLAERGCTVSPGVRLRTPAEVVDHLGSRGRTGIVDAIEIPPPGARTGTVHLRQEQAERRQDHGCSRTGTAGCCSAARPSPEAARTSPTPAGEGRSSSWPTGPPWKLLADAGYQGPGGADQRSGADTAAPQVQEEHPRLVQGDTRAAAEGTILTTHPPRAQAIALTRRVTSPHIRRISPGDPHREGPTPGPGRGRAHPAGRRGRWTRPRQPAHHAATSAPGSRPGKTFGDRDEQVSSVPRATRRAQTRRSRRPRTSRPCPTYTLDPRSRRLRPSSPSAGRSGRVP
ncbi:transposase family protein [Streptomyces cellulosae]